MHLVQILLPLADNQRHPFSRDVFDAVAREMTERFGGVTAHTRAPAEGRWAPMGAHHAEEMVVIEVMVVKLDEDWWHTYRASLEEVFRQERIIVRATAVQLL